MFLTFPSNHCTTLVQTYDPKIETPGDRFYTTNTDARL